MKRINRARFQDLPERKYKVHTLVCAEPHDTMEGALLREKQIKKWRRAWKLELIERGNPQWCDLFEEHLL